MFGKTLPDLEKQIDKLAKLCEKINLKLSPSKFTPKNILKKQAGIFKDKIGKIDRVNIPPVKLQLDETKDIPPTNVGKPFDVPYHLRCPARKKFREMEGGSFKVVGGHRKW